MQVKELKEKLEKDSTIGKFVRTKGYLGFVEKKVLCEKVVKGCLIEENGIMMCDHFSKKLTTDIQLVVSYSNLEFGKDFVGEYDYLAENKVLEHVLNKIDENEKKFICDMADKVIEEKLRVNNSVEAILAKGIEKLIKKLPDDKQMKSLIKAFSKEFKDFDIGKMETIGKMYADVIGVASGGVDKEKKKKTSLN